MNYYAIICEDTPDSMEKRRAVRPAHLQRLNLLEKEGRLLTAGPLFHSDADGPFANAIHGTLIVAQFDDVDEAKAWAAADPYVTAEIFGRINVFPYKVVYPNEEH